jgi:DNA (cytosine-5)-methyltransferase 1
MLRADAITVDSFAGGGGASLGMEMAAWRSPDYAINHDAIALSLHAVNHPHTEHRIEDVFATDPREIAKGRPIALAWFSPDCRHHSKAKGGRPVEKKIRALAWVVIRWAALPRPMKPAIIALENVEEFQHWGPLTADNLPCPDRKGQTFNLFVHRLRQAGYVVEWRELRACDYGAPTIRKRLFLIARADGQPIKWPKPTHGDPRSLEVAGGQLLPWRTAAECIEWSIRCPSIFARERPLADKTMARIARGVKRFVLDSAEPFIVPITHGGDVRAHPIDEPLRTVTGAHRGEFALATPFLAAHYGDGEGGKDRSSGMDDPVRTVTASRRHALVAPFFIPRHGEHETQQPRCRTVEEPMPTVDASATGASLVAAYMAQHNEGMVGHTLEEPVSTITAKGSHQQLVAAWLTKFYGSCRDGVDLRQPFPTVTAEGWKIAEVRAFLMRYYGTGGQLGELGQPLHTTTAKARLGLVTVAGVDWQIVDIGMRMLTPRELFRAQGFPDTYIIDRGADGTPITKTDQIRLCGNSVCPQVARAILEANFVNQAVGKGRAVA